MLLYLLQRKKPLLKILFFFFLLLLVNMQFCAVQEFLHFSLSGVFFNYFKYYVPPSDCIPVITFSSVRLHKYQESPVYAVGKALITNDEPTCASLLKMFMLSSSYYHATHDTFQYFRKHNRFLELLCPRMSMFLGENIRSLLSLCIPIIMIGSRLWLLCIGVWW